MSVDETSLAATIRAWRERLSPADVGITNGRSRRAVGLRREELADLAGLSVDYVVRLEQGRATTPSRQVVGGLARALQVSTAERDHLHRLAGLQPPADEFVSDHIPPGLQRIIARLGDAPVAVFAADWRLLWWNAAWAATLGDPSAVPSEARSLIVERFLSPQREVRASWLVEAEDQDASDRAIVADLRSAAARYPNDPELRALIRRTREGSARFASLWADATVGYHREDRKTISHPSAGPIVVDCDVLSFGDTGLKIVVYTAPAGSEEQSKLDLVRFGGVTAR